MPFTLFGYLSSPEEALRFLRQRGAAVEGNTEKWSASFTTKHGLLGRKRRVELNYDKQWCSPPNWPKQMAGMAGYLRNFAMSDSTRRTLLLGIIPRLTYSFGIIAEPEVEEENDARLEIITALASHLGALIFTPGTLSDPEMRPLASLNGDYDEQATFPEQAADGSTLQALPAPEEDDDDDDDDDADEPGEPATAQRAALRLYALVALVARALFDVNTAAGREPAYSLDQLRRWVDELELAEELETHEREALAAAAGDLSDRARIDGVWVVEGAIVLAWALGLAELPSYDEQVDVDTLFAAVGFLDTARCRRVLSAPSLRDATELEAFDEHMLAYHWRMVDYRVAARAIRFDEVEIFGGPFDLTWAKLADGDLCLRGTRIDGCEDGARRLCSSISIERFRAANWLVGLEEIYSETPTDT